MKVPENENNEAIQPEEVETANINDGEQDIVDEFTEAEAESEVEVDADEKAEKGKESTEKAKKFGKKEKKKDPKDILIDELIDKNRRQMAEFDNFRKRTEKEKSVMYEIGAKDIIEKILPIVDNFERGFDAISDEEKSSPFTEGIEKVFKQLTKALEDAGVKTIEAVGQPFDPNFHNAVMHIEDEELGENVVADEFQKGYIYRESVVRHSMVKVAN
ncbi:nucleotide exchange factor GrpE [[Clostridium] fimetarium]|uniref:Protein GrpE n=1 Tax=[Clostridium] fimetarium TaxID=99656 RepID=A0A1I0RJW3_9FIRM|nr:nucleotide exchange factor GrpE [[Clostridium] fimetarium]SEW41336.1 molecular chaperone GrpE [[Clostridium] fimetarium]